ncbi:MAG: hypothetical protein GXO83_07635 [Chlorobi bacterium]|nr:hypothetical protein [Chlorobiota bacterium]
MKKYIYILITTLFFTACSKEKILPGQADSFMKFFGNAFLDTGSDVKQTPDKGYIVVGTLVTVNEDEYRKTPEDRDIYIVKTDPYGNKIWDKQIGGPFDDYGNAVQLTSDGGFIIAGTTFDTTSAGNQVSNCLLVKISGDGTIQWNKSFGGIDNQEGNFVTITGSGDYLVAGNTTASRVAGGGFEGNPAGEKDIFIMKVSTSGDSLWSEAFGFAGDDVANCIREKSDGGLIILGTTDHSEAGQDKNNLIIISTNSTGKGPVNKTFGGEGDDYGHDLRVLPDGYLITGTYERNGVSNAYLAKLKTNIFDTPSFEKYFGDATITSGNAVFVKQDGTIAICGSSGINGNRNILFIKTDTSGELITMETYGGAGDQWASALDGTADGGFVIAGSNEFDGNALITLLKISGDGSL